MIRNCPKTIRNGPKTIRNRRKHSENEKIVMNHIPIGHQLIDYHGTASGKKRVEDKIKEWESADCHCLIFGTSFFGTNKGWEGLGQLINDLSDKKLLKKKFWKIFTFHKNLDAKQTWPQRLVEIEKMLKNLIDNFSIENKIKFDIEPLPYSEPKEKILDDKKAA